MSRYTNPEHGHGVVDADDGFDGERAGILADLRAAEAEIARMRHALRAMIVAHGVTERGSVMDPCSLARAVYALACPPSDAR
jgi:hypothetical protein